MVLLCSPASHRIGRAHARYVIDNSEPFPIAAGEEADARLVWIGEDDRGVELEIVPLDLPDMLVVIHVMPTALRQREGGHP